MDLKEASVSLKVPVTVLNRMAKDGLLGNPLDERDIHTVSVLGHLLGKKWFAGAVLKEIKMRRERITVALFPDYDKIDLYILNTYLNEPEGKQVPVYLLQYRLKKAFSAEIGNERIRKLRQVAYDIKRGRSKLKLGKSAITYAELMGIEIDSKKRQQREPNRE